MAPKSKLQKEKNRPSQPIPVLNTRRDWILECCKPTSVQWKDDLCLFSIYCDGCERKGDLQEREYGFQYYKIENVPAKAFDFSRVNKLECEIRHYKYESMQPGVFVSVHPSKGKKVVEYHDIANGKYSPIPRDWDDIHWNSIRINDLYDKLDTKDIPYSVEGKTNDLPKELKNPLLLFKFHGPMNYFRNVLGSGLARAQILAGGAGSISSFHSEDHDLAAVNVMQSGGPKFWMIVHKASVELLCHKAKESTGFKGPPECVLRSKSLHFPPWLLNFWGVKFVMILQRPNEVLFLNPGVVHGVLNLSFCFNVAMNLIPLNPTLYIDIINFKPCQCPPRENIDAEEDANEEDDEEDPDNVFDVPYEDICKKEEKETFNHTHGCSFGQYLTECNLYKVESFYNREKRPCRTAEEARKQNSKPFGCFYNCGKRFNHLKSKNRHEKREVCQKEKK